MAKQQGKRTRKDKIQEGKNGGAQAAPKPKKVKVKGPAPSYTPNLDKVLAREHQVMVEQQKELPFLIAQAQATYDDLVVNQKPGTYLIGINRSGKGPEAHTVILEERDFPATETHAASKKVVIRDVEVGIWIFFDLLFRPVHTCRFPENDLGATQRKMLIFFQDALHGNIAAEKQRRKLAEAEAAQKAAEAPQATPAARLVTVGGIRIADPAVKSDQKVSERCFATMSPLSDFVPGAFGAYNMNDGDKHCNIDYFATRQGSLIVITDIHPEHKLAKAGVRVGLELFGKVLSKERPIAEILAERLGQEHYSHLVLAREFYLSRLDEVQDASRMTA